MNVHTVARPDRSSRAKPTIQSLPRNGVLLHALVPRLTVRTADLPLLPPPLHNLEALLPSQLADILRKAGQPISRSI